MAELVDAADLKSVAHCERGSSSLPTPILIMAISSLFIAAMVLIARLVSVWRNIYLVLPFKNFNIFQYSKAGRL